MTKRTDRPLRRRLFFSLRKSSRPIGLIRQHRPSNSVQRIGKNRFLYARTRLTFMDKNLDFIRHRPLIILDKRSRLFSVLLKPLLPRLHNRMVNVDRGRIIESDQVGEARAELRRSRQLVQELVALRHL